MTRPEADVWDAFRRANQGALTEIYYNVHVGTVIGDDPADDPETRRLRATLYAKRVDVIARTPTDTWVIEVKDHARASALGQLLIYLPAVADRFPAWRNLRAILLSNTRDPDLEAVCGSLKVECYTPPFAALRPTT